MPTRKIIFLLALAVFLLSLYLLVSGSALLLLPLDKKGEVPLGTITSWLGIIALPTAAYTGIGAFHRPGSKVIRWYRAAIKTLILLAACWGFVSYYLAGNWSFSFSGSAPSFRASAEAAPYFWYYSALVVLLPVLFLFWYGIHCLVWGQRKKA